MKSILTVCMLPMLMLTVISCGDDSDPEPVSPIVASWELEVVSISNYPMGFETNAQLFPPEVVGIDFSPESWTFSQDDTYLIEIENPGFNFTEIGTYVFEGSSLELIPDEFNGQITDFEVSEITDANLVLSFEISRNLYTNAFIEQIVALPADSVVADSVFAANLVEGIQLTSNLIFEKRDTE